MQIPALSNFRLAGGTALALQKGHRSSIDIDLFSDKEFANELVLQALEAYLFPRKAINVRTYSFGFFCTIDDIKTDFMFWGDEFVLPPLIIDDIRMADSLEIFAMKLDAITGRKVKKDYFDIALLLDNYSLEEGLKFYEKKYPYNDVSSVLKQLTLLDDADETPDPQMFQTQSWADIKSLIIAALKKYWDEQVQRI